MAGDVVVRVVQFTIPGGYTGLLSIGTAGLGDKTPKAVLFFGGAAADQDTLETIDKRHFMGFAAGAASRVNHEEVPDNQGTTNTSRRWRNDQCLQCGTFLIATLSAFVTNGVTINIGTNSLALNDDRRFTAVFFAGADVSAAVGNASLPAATNGTTTINTLAFQPDLVFLSSPDTSNAANVNTSGARIGMGAGERAGGGQVAIADASRSGDTRGGVPQTAIYDNAALVGMTDNASTAAYTVVVNNFTSSGFDLACTGTTASQVVNYLALKLDGVAVKLGSFTAATSTGNSAQTGPGFSPQAVLLFSTTQTTKNAVVMDGATSVGVSVSAFDRDQRASSHSTRDENTADPSNVAELTAPNAYMIGSATDVDAVRASLVSLDATGFTLNFDQVSGSANFICFVAIEQGISPTVDATPPRVSQHAMLLLDNPVSLPRISQHVLLIYDKPLPLPEISQHSLLIMAENFSYTRVSQQVLLVHADYQPCLTRRAQLWKISRRDGVVLAFTSHDREISFGGVTYTPCNSLQASASHQAGDQEGMSNVELSGIISDDAITETDIEAGKYDDAYVETYLVAWRNPDDGVVSVDSVRRLNAGWVGTVSAGERGVRMEILGPGQRLAQKAITKVYTAGCRFQFGDANTCGVDIDALKLPGTITAVTDNGYFTATVSQITADAQYDQGFVRWLTGPNAGADTEVKEIDFLSGGLATITLWSTAPYMPEVGDTFDLFPGCDRLAATCKDVYDNKINFGGFDTVPGNDAIGKTPDSKH